MSDSSAILRTPNGRRSYEIVGDERDDSVLAAITRAGGTYEAHVYGVAAAILRRDSIVLDVGANIGATCIQLSGLVPDGWIFALEASPVNFAYLERNLSINEVKNVRTFRLAAYDRPGKLVLHHIDEFAGGAFVPAATSTYNDTRARHFEVDGVRLDDWIAERRIERLDLVKMDIEGAESAALAGAVNTIRRLRPALLVEYNLFTIQTIQNEPPSRLFDQLVRLFREIYVIDRVTCELIPTATFSELEKILSDNDRIADLLCTQDPAGKRFARDVTARVRRTVKRLGALFRH